MEIEEVGVWSECWQDVGGKIEGAEVDAFGDADMIICGKGLLAQGEGFEVLDSTEVINVGDAVVVET